MPSITQLEYIIAVNKLKHFGRAAKECYVSQPSLSTQVQKVEEIIGFLIFDRSKKPLMTTDKGKLFIEQSKKILNAHSKLFEIEKSEKGVSGKFHLGVIPTLSAYILPLFLEKFCKTYPQVELEISELKTEQIINKLHEDEIDAGLLVTPLNENSIIEKPLFVEPFYVFTSESHKFFKKKILNSNELTSDDLWLLQEGHCFREQVLNVCSLKSTNSFKAASNKLKALANDSKFLPVKFESGNLETLINLIRNGSGYTLIPHMAIRSLTEKEKNNNLKKIKTPTPSREVSLVHSRSDLKIEILKALEGSIKISLPDGLIKVKLSKHKVIDI